ncbi:unnamed protein product [Lampetra fluviatilis]
MNSCPGARWLVAPRGGPQGYRNGLLGNTTKQQLMLLLKMVMVVMTMMVVTSRPARQLACSREPLRVHPLGRRVPRSALCEGPGSSWPGNNAALCEWHDSEQRAAAQGVKTNTTSLSARGGGRDVSDLAPARHSSERANEGGGSHGHGVCDGREPSESLKDAKPHGARREMPRDNAATRRGIK